MERVLLLVKLQVAILQGVFRFFLNCANGLKWHKTIHKFNMTSKALQGHYPTFYMFSTPVAQSCF